MRNQAKLLPVEADTVGLWPLQPRKPLNIAGANGGFKSDEGPSSFDLLVDSGTDNLLFVGPAPGTYAAFFDGSLILARSAYDAALDIKGDVTMEALVYPTELPSGFKDIVAFAGGPADDQVNNTIYQMGVEGSGASCHPFYAHENLAGVNNTFIWDTGAAAVSLPINEWTYLAMVRDDTAKTVTLYINGTAHPVAYTYTNSPTGGSTSRLSIGGFWSANIQQWNGGLASVRISNTARTATQIAAAAALTVASRAANMATPALLPEVVPSAHASLRSWVEAGSHDLDDGDSVQTPTTIAGAASDFTQATLGNRPLIYPAAGEVGWKTFDGTAGRSWASGTSITDFMQLSPARYHVFVPFVMHSAELNSGSLWLNHRLFGDASGWWGAYARRTGGVSSGDFEVYGYHWDGSAKITPHVVSLNEPHLFEMWYDAGSSETVSRVDDGPEVRVAAGVVSGSANMEFCGSGANFFMGAVFGAMFANDFDLASQAGIRNYYANKYGMDV